MFPGVPRVDRGNWGRERDIFLYRKFAFSFVNDVLYRILSVVKKVLERITPCTFVPHTKLAIVFGTGRSTNGSLEACQVSKVHARLVVTR